jgi:hypothetical protein
MRWNHLPVPGGIYDQHPKLLEQFQTIFQRLAVEEQREADRRKREMQRGRTK